MSCDNELANEWVRCSGKNASYVTMCYVEMLQWFGPGLRGMISTLFHLPPPPQELSIIQIFYLQFCFPVKFSIDHFTVVCSVTWPLNGSEAGVDLVLIQTSKLLSCKCT